MMSKVIIEIRFSKLIHRNELENLVLYWGARRKELIGNLKKLDPKVDVRVWFEKHEVKIGSSEMPSILRIFSGGGKA